MGGVELPDVLDWSSTDRHPRTERRRPQWLIGVTGCRHLDVELQAHLLAKNLGAYYVRVPSITTPIGRMLDEAERQYHPGTVGDDHESHYAYQLLMAYHKHELQPQIEEEMDRRHVVAAWWDGRHTLDMNKAGIEHQRITPMLNYLLRYPDITIALGEDSPSTIEERNETYAFYMWCKKFHRGNLIYYPHKGTKPASDNAAQREILKLLVRKKMLGVPGAALYESRGSGSIHLKERKQLLDE